MSQHFDIVIVGAGIHGAAIAEEAAKRQKHVLVLEQFDQPAQGTSSKSSKLIHGGLRYLETFQFKLVAECLRERGRLLKTYPDLVHLQKFHIPVYNDTSRSQWVIRTGLTLYSALTGFRENNRFRKVPKREWGELDSINTEGLKAVFQYFDAQTNDAELTKRILEESGADVAMPASLESCVRVNQHLDITYSENGEHKTIQTDFLINAAGPWVNDVAKRCTPAPQTLPVDLVQGAHIELPGELTKGCYYMEAPSDRRAVFAMPWKGHTLVGTTETMYEGDPAACAATGEEIDYLLEVFNHYFPSKPKNREDVLASWAGLRVLPQTDGSPFGRSRDTFVIPDNPEDPKIYGIYGGKLTSHHAAAVKVLDRL